MCGGDLGKKFFFSTMVLYRKQKQNGINKTTTKIFVGNIEMLSCWTRSTRTKAPETTWPEMLSTRTEAG